MATSTPNLGCTSQEINVGLNGIGRIGKCLLMQVSNDPFCWTNYALLAQ